MSTEMPTGSRHEYELTDTDCPQGCADTAPCWRGMWRVTHYTGEYKLVSTPQCELPVERTETYLECPQCGRMVDL